MINILGKDKKEGERPLNITKEIQEKAKEMISLLEMDLSLDQYDLHDLMRDLEESLEKLDDGIKWLKLRGK